MKVAIVLYHLEPGGVTRVIENTLDSFTQHSRSIDFVVLSGRPYRGNQIPNHLVVDGLDYSSPNSRISAKALKGKMEVAAFKGLGCKPDLWHIHNHSLGKNPSLTAAVALLAESGTPLLLHPHDFAEDGRPSNFNALAEVYPITYPSASHVHYATLNHRDYSFVNKFLKGKKSQVHLLANSIGLPNEQEKKKRASFNLPQNLFVYPVRAVRRKNLGELALIASTYPEKHFANTLGPTNPNFLNTFERWKQFTKNHNLPVSFAIGEQTNCSFQEMINHSDGIITTSIAEGFGLGFLEPWMFEKFLCGRNIPEITQDFSNLGINLKNLYNRINIDIKHLNDSLYLRKKIHSALIKYFTDYRKPLPKHATETAYHSMVQENEIDFGRVDESQQEEIICSVLKSKTTQQNIRSQINLEKVNLNIIQKNKIAVIKKFSQQNYVKKLNLIYESLTGSGNKIVEYANGEELLSSFLSPERLNLLRTS